MNKFIAKFLCVAIIGGCINLPYDNCKVVAAEKEQQFIVLYNEEEDVNKILSEKDIVNIKKDNKLERKNIALVNIKPSVANELKKKSNIIVERDILVNASTGKNKKVMTIKRNRKGDIDKYAWNIKMINADNINKVEKENDNVKVAVVDSGIDSTEDYNIVEHINLVNSEKNIAEIYEDRTGHGTSIAGIIAGNNDCVKGINSNVDLYSVKVLDENNQAPISRVVEAIYWCIENKINIINMSFGTNIDSEILHKAIKEAYKNNILIIAAAGNTGESVQFPACYSEVMAVGSVDSKANISNYSCVGDEVEILAPGENVETYGGFGGYVIASGTSMAAPHIVGVASILWQKDINCSNAFIRYILKKSARKIENNDLKECGIVDEEYALDIYDEEKKVYTGEEMDSILENSNKVDTFDTDEYVQGQWNGSSHQSSVDSGNSIAWNQIDVSFIRSLVDKSDSSSFNGFNFREKGALHGSYNYVANLKYLFNVAKRVRGGNSVDTAISNTTYADSSYKDGNGAKTAASITTDLNESIRAISRSGGTNEQKCQCILALAFHLAGDIYAHESVLPRTVITNTQSSGNSMEIETKVAGNYFNLKQFTTTEYNEMKTAIGKSSNDKYLKFSKIKDYGKAGYNTGTYYEDNTNFYSSRFNRGTRLAVKAMIDDMYTDNDYFSIWVLLPEDYFDEGYSIKRYKFKTFANSACSLNATQRYLVENASVKD